MRSIAETFDFGTLPSGTRERFVLLTALSVLACQQVGLYAVVLISGYYPDQWYSLNLYIFSIILVFFLCVAVLYCLHPIGVRGRFGVGAPLPPELESACKEIASKAGVTHVEFSLTKRLLQQDAIAFGFPYFRLIRLGGGLKLVFKKRPDVFAAIIAHELAHIRNKDVDIAYLSRALFTSLVILTSLSLGFALCRLLFELSRTDLLKLVRDVLATYDGTGSPDQVYNELWVRNSLIAYAFQLISLGLIVLLAAVEYRALLRGREHYADVGACLTVGRDPVLDVVGPTSVPRRSLLQRLLAFHPTSARRAEVIADPTSLLVPAQVEVAFTGYVFGIILQNLYGLGLLSNSGTLMDYVKNAVSSLTEFVTQATPLILMFVFILVLGSQNLRSSMSVGFGTMPYKRFVVYSVVSSVTWLASLSIGCLANPYLLGILIFRGGQSYYTIDAFQFSTLFSSTMLTSLIFGLYFRFAYPVVKLRRLGRPSRFALLFLWLYMAIQWAQIIFLWFGASEMGVDDQIWLPFLLGLLSYVLVILVLLGIMAALARAKTRRENDEPNRA